MLVCLIDESEGKRTEKFKYILTIRGVEVYALHLPVKRGKGAKPRTVKREIKRCRKRGVSFFCLSSKSPYNETFRRLGESTVGERRIFLSRASQLALNFSKAVDGPERFFISGGGARAVSEIACELLSCCRFVFSDTQEFERASELVLQKTGAPLRRGNEQECVKIKLLEGDIEFSWKEKSARICDFFAVIENNDFKGVPENLRPLLISVLELVGKIGRNEIKTACLIK